MTANLLFKLKQEGMCAQAHTLTHVQLTHGHTHTYARTHTHTNTWKHSVFEVSGGENKDERKSAPLVNSTSVALSLFRQTQLKGRKGGREETEKVKGG